MMRNLFGVIQLVVAIALMGLIGQAVLYVLAGPDRENNVFYRIIKVIPSPFVKLFRFITPRTISDRMIPFAAFCGLSAIFLWLALAIPRMSS